MPLLLRSQSHLVVVDPRPSGYHGLVAMVEQHRWCVQFITTASAALRFFWSTPPELWIVNTRLPDMAGLDLLEMLRQRQSQAVVLIVSDQCEADDERRACRAGATSYLCGGPSVVLDWVRAFTRRTTTELPDAFPLARTQMTVKRIRQAAHPP